MFIVFLDHTVENVERSLGFAFDEKFVITFLMIRTSMNKILLRGTLLLGIRWCAKFFPFPVLMVKERSIIHQILWTSIIFTKHCPKQYIKHYSYYKGGFTGRGSSMWIFAPSMRIEKLKEKCTYNISYNKFKFIIFEIYL